MNEIEQRALRFKDAILNNGGYEYVSESTGINLRTLKRIAAGQSDPRFSDVIKIAEATDTKINFFASGENPFDRFSDGISNFPELLSKALMAQQQQTEKTIDTRLKRLEQKLSHLSFKDQQAFKEELAKTTEEFESEAKKETQELLEFTDFIKDIRDVAVGPAGETLAKSIVKQQDKHKEERLDEIKEIKRSRRKSK